jgi:hypothetical protein
MASAGRERGKEIRKQPAGGGKRQENAKKILNRGNEPKDLLKTQNLAFFEAKNEPKRTQNELGFERKRSRSKRKKQVVSARFQVVGARGLSKAELSNVKAESRTDEVTTGEGCAT